MTPEAKPATEQPGPEATVVNKAAQLLRYIITSRKPGDPPVDSFTAQRETVESIVVAVILALLFRAFVAEAFVIPTGSMAPTLMGRHIDVACDQCGYAYQAGASAERDREDRVTNLVTRDTRCPACGYRKTLDLATNFSNETSFSGDRIIVSKFAYEFAEPQRWDVIVFKYPEGAQQNYIKRLIGLPGETIRIIGGNIYVKQPGKAEFAIARKPPDRLLAMLQIVHDADHNAPALAEAKWPKRWQSHSSKAEWQAANNDASFEIAPSDQPAELRYHHVEPFEADWHEILSKRKQDPFPHWPGGLITDFYAYNCARNVPRDAIDREPSFGPDNSPAFGQFWVDDLALECTLDATSADGLFTLDLVRGGIRHACTFDLAKGTATLSMRDRSGNAVKFGEKGEGPAELVAENAVSGAGSYQVRLSNVDHEMRVWVNDRPLEFPTSAAYASEELILPQFSENDQGDFAPAGISAERLAGRISQIRVLRDKYYVADSGQYGDREYRTSPNREIVMNTFAQPHLAEIHELLAQRRGKDYALQEHQFMPLGDNSPASSDARFWREPYVERHLLIGKALCVFWPHTWNQPAYWPNWRKIRPIR